MWLSVELRGGVSHFNAFYGAETYIFNKADCYANHPVFNVVFF